MRAASLVFAAALALATSARAQISPGELAQAHAFLEGVKNCLRCHQLGAGPSAEKCMECHVEIGERVRDKKGLHHVVVNVQGRACFSCHSDHAGRNFQLVLWPEGRDNFDHAQAGWELEGAHASQDCRSCHREAFIAASFDSKHVNSATTFLGLDTSCRGCHFDEHRGQLGLDCASCHGQGAWRPAQGFDHARTHFALTGKHVAVACAKCHAGVKDARKEDADGSYLRFAETRHETCARCHEDTHRGKFGGECSSCHSTEGWRQILTASFDHSRTRFPLRGRHAKVECRACHVSGTMSAAVAFAACTDCHHDPHRGQFARRADQGRCDSCHGESGFVPSTFTVTAHVGTRHALEGAHLAVACVACHGLARDANGSFRRFRIPFDTCDRCHDDAHRGQLASKQCTSCHRVTEWPDIYFKHDRDTAYALEGQHRRVPCDGCHQPVTAGGATFVRYKPIDPSCQTCHANEPMQLGRS
ncbi:MAG: hypothetical protein OEO21_11780 [Candidatus Krumholzibacteria bacterium]|nr:hypothetical protein [Candidatus Krumholzibacteria bacterium]